MSDRNVIKEMMLLRQQRRVNVCPEGGMSPEHSPLNILTDERLDCDCHSRHHLVQHGKGQPLRGEMVKKMFDKDRDIRHVHEKTMKHFNAKHEEEDREIECGLQVAHVADVILSLPADNSAGINPDEPVRTLRTSTRNI